MAAALDSDAAYDALCAEHRHATAAVEAAATDARAAEAAEAAATAEAAAAKEMAIAAAISAADAAEAAALAPLKAAAAEARAAEAGRRATSIAALAAVRAHPAHAFRHSPVRVLDSRAALRLVTDRVPAADALFAALVCRATRDLMSLRFERRAGGENDVGLRGKRFATPDRAVVCSVSRLEWALSLSSLPGADLAVPGWGAGRGAIDPVFGQESVCDRIARAGQLLVLQRAVANGHSSGQSTCAAAAAAGKLEMLQWLVATLLDGVGLHSVVLECSLGYLRVNSEVLRCAARGGHLTMVKWLWEADRVKMKAGKWYDAAAEGGQLEVLKYLRANCADYLSDSEDWLGNSCDWGNETCNAAAAGGHLDVLKWMRANGCPWDPADANALEAAAEHGHLEVVKWCLETGMEFDEYACTAATRGVSSRF
eukprot:SAG22_NODE_96_length_20771_cov_33.186018_15_plen_426_part_00